MNNTIVATTPEAMQSAQPVVIGWVQDRLAKAQADLADAEALMDALGTAGMDTKLGASIHSRAKRRIKFYQKVRAALEAGYVIIPPFDIQAFAVRTNRADPPAVINERGWDRNEVTVPVLPAGEGRWVDPMPKREVFGKHKRKNDAGHEYEVTIYQNSPWSDLTLPVRAMKPQVIQATAKALQEKIFDAIGIAPAYRASDPIIAGQIRGPGGKTITFFVAWWLDENDLP